MTIETYSVTIDIPGGRSWGYSFDNLNEASNQFGEAWKGSHPTGTVVTLWEGEGESAKELDTATVGPERFAAYADAISRAINF